MSRKDDYNKQGNYQHDEDSHPWDELSVKEILLGFFAIGIVIGLIVNLIAV